MKKILLLLFVCMMACMVQSSYGAFVVKPAVVNHPAVITKSETTTATAHKTSIVSRLREKLLVPSHIYGIHNVRGIYGTLALVAGILSFIPLYGILFGAAAIVLGTIGIHKHNKLALLGLILGCTGIAANLVYLTILIVQSLTGFGVIAVF